MYTAVMSFEILFPFGLWVSEPGYTGLRRTLMYTAGYGRVRMYTQQIADRAVQTAHVPGCLVFPAVLYKPLALAIQPAIARRSTKLEHKKHQTPRRS